MSQNVSPVVVRSKSMLATAAARAGVGGDRRNVGAPIGASRHPVITSVSSAPLRRSGTPAAGRIVKLFVGRGHGFIRLADDRTIYFHRADVAGGSINDLVVGDAVVFELFEDVVSGARALRVTPRRRFS
jgi:cold shock CspA family protein